MIPAPSDPACDAGRPPIEERTVTTVPFFGYWPQLVPFGRLLDAGWAWLADRWPHRKESRRA